MIKNKVARFYGSRCIIQELVRARRRLQQRNLPGGDTSEDQGEQNLTLVMVIIIVIFVVCQSPAFGNQLLYYLIGEEQYACGKVGSNLFTILLSAFMVYCFCSLNHAGLSSSQNVV